MSRNGSGIYSLPSGNPVVTGTTISSTWANTTLNDIASALTQSVSSDGQTPMTGSLNTNGNQIINLGAGSVAGNAVEWSQFQAAIGGGGMKIIQTVVAFGGNNATTTSSSPVPTGHTASITPTSSSSKILILHSSSLAQTNIYATSGLVFTAVYRNGSNIIGSDAATQINVNANGTGASTYSSIAFTYLDSPATTSALTYSIYFWQNNSGSALYNQLGTGNIVLLEIL